MCFGLDVDRIIIREFRSNMKNAIPVSIVLAAREKFYFKYMN